MKASRACRGGPAHIRGAWHEGLISAFAHSVRASDYWLRQHASFKSGEFMVNSRREEKAWDSILQVELPVPAVKFIEKLAGKIKKEIERSDIIDVADIGCGRGELIHYLAKNLPNCNFTGYDLSANTISNLKKEALSNEEFHHLCLPDVPERSFDCVLCINTLHYIPDPMRTIKKLWSIVRPGGILIFNYPNRYYVTLLPPKPPNEEWKAVEWPMRTNMNLLSQKQIQKALPGARQRLLHKSGRFNIYLIFEKDTSYFR